MVLEDQTHICPTSWLIYLQIPDVLYYSGINAMGVSNHFLEMDLGPFYEMEPIPDTVNGAKNLKLNISQSLGGGEPTINILKRNNNKIIPNKLLIYP